MNVVVLAPFYRKRDHDAITPDLEALQIRIVEELKKIVPETQHSIDVVRQGVDKATEFMRSGVDVLSGAKASGIINIFPTRYDQGRGTSAVEIILRDIPNENAQIRVMGISLGDYFLDRGLIHGRLIELLDKNKGTERGDTPLVRALIVNPYSETLRERARWEAGMEYYADPAFYDSTTFIETDGAARIAKRLCESYPGLLEVRIYDQTPTAFVLLTSRFAFTETYTYAARGSKVPMLQVQAGEPLYSHFESHFENIWRVADKIGCYAPAVVRRSVRKARPNP